MSSTGGPLAGPSSTRGGPRWLTPRNVAPLAVVMTLLAGLGDYLTGIEVTFTLAYLCPIALATWFSGRPLALFCTVLATACAVFTAFSYVPLLPIHVIIWNSAGVAGVLLIVVWALDRLRGFVSGEQEERRAAVEQVRHGERLATVGKLAAGIAHELGTPLSIVAGHAQMIVAREVEGDRAIESAKSIDREATRMAKIVRQLLDFSRRKGPEAMDCDLSDIAKRCAKLFAPVAEKARVALSVVGAEDRSLVRGDAESIQQVVTNLVANAIDAMPAGGALKIQLCRVVEARAAGGTSKVSLVRLDVVDTGTGMPPEVVAHAFDPFFTTKPSGSGTGLGLSVVDGIVRDHGGWITLASHPGAGTTISVFLPVAVV
jgi:two-component system NtrC family sensor kinase